VPLLSRLHLFVLTSVVALGLSGCVAADGGSNVPPPGPSNHYLFRDEFTGGSLDLSRWQPNWLGPSNGAITKPINGAEISCYDPAQVRVPGDGYLHLAAAHRSCTANNGARYSYASGLVQTFPHFRFTEGYLEARVWLPGSTSIHNWPAVWTDGTGTWPSTGESDVMEGLSGKACYHYHSPSGGPGGCVAGTFTGWHTFAEEVYGGVTTYYYDGVRVGAKSSVKAPHYIILNLGIGGWGGPVAAPSEMLVDYVRVSYHK
jgi:beta-glucanase (GH16 family)